jgi:hypothetical protein
MQWLTDPDTDHISHMRALEELERIDEKSERRRAMAPEQSMLRRARREHREAKAAEAAAQAESAAAAAEEQEHKRALDEMVRAAQRRRVEEGRLGHEEEERAQKERRQAKRVAERAAVAAARAAAAASKTEVRRNAAAQAEAKALRYLIQKQKQLGQAQEERDMAQAVMARRLSAAIEAAEHRGGPGWKGLPLGVLKEILTATPRTREALVAALPGKLARPLSEFEAEGKEALTQGAAKEAAYDRPSELRKVQEQQQERAREIARQRIEAREKEGEQARARHDARVRRARRETDEDERKRLQTWIREEISHLRPAPKEREVLNKMLAEPKWQDLPTLRSLWVKLEQGMHERRAQHSQSAP